MTIAAVIACRMGSSRLPGKSAKHILGVAMVGRMIERVRRSRFVNEIVIATSDQAEDAVLADLAASVGARCFRGSPDDVLDRMNSAVRHVAPDTVVELLGDNPLVHADLIDDVIAFYREGGYEYAASVTTEYPQAGSEVRKFPLGIRVQVFAPQALERTAATATDPYYRENSTAFMCERPDLFRVGYFEARGRWGALNRPELNFAVNLPKNFELITAIFERCHPRDPNFTLQEALAVYDGDPRLHPLMGS